MAEKYGLTESDGEGYRRLVMGIYRRMKGLRKKLLLVVRKAGGHWRDQPRDRYGRWVKENGSLVDWEALLIPDPTPEKCRRIFDELYRRDRSTHSIH
ncbi:MAG: hypothetical protein H5T86_06005 [Armatimonadetes bacterium]|nr:hypothetical protein [Armatimonadota bacterium]